MTPSEIREKREGLGLTKSQAARLFGVAPRTWRRWETGQLPVTRAVALVLIIVSLVPTAAQTLLRIAVRQSETVPPDDDEGGV